MRAETAVADPMAIPATSPRPKRMAPVSTTRSLRCIGDLFCQTDFPCFLLSWLPSVTGLDRNQGFEHVCFRR